MMVKRFRCRHCGLMFPCRVKGQKYCKSKECQGERRRRWARDKYRSDPDYRFNQQASTEAWLEQQGGSAAYYREYRRRKREEKLALSAGSQCDKADVADDAEIEPGELDKDSTTEWLDSTNRETEDDVGSSDVLSKSSPALDDSLQSKTESEGVECANRASDYIGSANSDATFGIEPIKTVICKIFASGANSDAFMAKIEVISKG